MAKIGNEDLRRAVLMSALADLDELVAGPCCGDTYGFLDDHKEKETPDHVCDAEVLAAISLADCVGGSFESMKVLVATAIDVGADFPPNTLARYINYALTHLDRATATLRRVQSALLVAAQEKEKVQ